ncbi:cytochrome P450 [Cantharellus anzutake]|uniref:cytochrome P450 n=1 Tax=Cantharellus anzutake TaxID=1750568 RepID=UPI0019050DDC|nr:cytochrome P450 [Cantharellus anzutake]KAF8333963.1 cytochrome P450 [Cantharellus anzutake]
MNGGVIPRGSLSLLVQGLEVSLLAGFFAKTRSIGKYSHNFEKHTVDAIAGNIVGFDLFGRQLIILNSYEVAKDMLATNASIYSDRPSMVMSGKLMGAENTGFSQLRYGLEWREQRAMLHQLMTRKSMTQFHGALRRAALRILVGALENSLALGDLLRLHVGAVILKTTYGIDVKNSEDRYLQVVVRLVKAVNFTFFGQHLVDFFPILLHIPRSVPFVQFRKEAEFLRATREELLNRPFEYALSQEPLSLVNRLIQSGRNPRSVRLATGALYIAGVDTTLITFKTFLTAMMLYPEVQKKAQEELDAVLGTSSKHEVLRLPTFDDQDKLPYLNAVIKEVHRWHPVFPLGVSHAPVEDNVYAGYFIPRDSIIMPNQWAMSRDEHHYPEPEQFRPERFLGDNPALDPKEFILGFGRRKCVGLHFADAVIFITFASILSTFNITKRTGDRYVEPNLRVGHAGPIDEAACDLAPRSPGTAALINTSLESLDDSS